MEELRSLLEKNMICLDDLPIQFGRDLQNFIQGKTLSMRENKVVIGHNLYKKLASKNHDQRI